MHIRCPHCHQPIEVVEEARLADVTCPSCGSNFSLIADSIETVEWQGRRIAHFELLDQVGQGAYGVVWRARDTILQRTVAVKIPRQSHLSASDREFFFRDARAAAQLHHPNVVSVFEVGRDNDTIFIASEFVQGVTLTEWLQAHPPTHRQAAELIAQVADAVQHAHERGVVHRDLKPGNILIDAQGQPHVTDFGLAKREAGEITMTIDGQVLGTPAYMSPEQAKGESHSADARSDVYSLGVILFELLTGELPFRGTKQMLLLQILSDEPPRPRKLNQRIPRDLETICLKAMSKEPRRRYETAGALADDLRRYLSGQPIFARPVGRLERGWRWCKRQPIVASLLAAVFLSLTTGVAVSAIFAWRESIQRTAAERLANERGRLVREYTELADQKTSLAYSHASSVASERLQRVRLQVEQGWMQYSAGRVDLAVLLWCHTLVDLERSDGRITPFSPDRFAYMASLSTSERTHHAAYMATLARSIREQIVHAALSTNYPRMSLWSRGRIQFGAFSPDGKTLATASLAGTALWDVATGKQLGELPQDKGLARALRFSPDGTMLATASEDKTARLWDVATIKPLREPLLHDDAVEDVVFSPDGLKVATASKDKTARLWDVATGQQLSAPLEHDALVDGVVFSPDGTKLATGSQDVARVWDVATSKLLAGPFRHKAVLRGVRFSPDGTKLATCSKDKTARLWDVATGKPLYEPLLHGEHVEDIAFGPDGTKVATASWDYTARLWDVATGRPLTSPLQHDHTVIYVMFSPDGAKLATASQDQTARLWDAATGKQLVEPLRHNAIVTWVSFSPDGTKLATADGVARLWDVATGRPVSEVLQRDGTIPPWIAFSPDGRKLATASEDKTARLWDVATGKPLGEPLPHDDSVRRVTFSPDGTKLATMSPKTVRLWDAETGRLLGEPLRHIDWISSVAFSPDGTKLATGSGDKMARLWDVATGKPLGASIQHNDAVYDVSFSPHGTMLATASFDKTARLWDVATGKPLGEPLLHKDRVGVAVFSSDGSKLATWCADSTARLWDVATGKPLSEPLQHNGTVYDISFSPDGKKLATASFDGTARLWHAHAGFQLVAPLKHIGDIPDLSFSADGLKLVTGSKDLTARFWDVTTGKQLGEPMLHNHEVWRVEFSPDGTKVATGSFDGTIRFWDVPRAPDEPADQLLFWAEVTAGAESDDAGRIQPLTVEQIRDKQQALESAGGPPRAWLEALEKRRAILANTSSQR